MDCKQLSQKTNSKHARKPFFLPVRPMKKTWVMNISWNWIKKHLICMVWSMLDIFTHLEASLRFTRSSSQEYMVTVPELFVISRKLCLLDSVTNWKHPGSKSSVPDVKKFTCPSSEVSTLMEPTLVQVSLMCFWSIIQKQSSYHQRCSTTNLRSLVSMSTRREDPSTSNLLLALWDTLRILWLEWKERSYSSR